MAKLAHQKALTCEPQSFVREKPLPQETKQRVIMYLLAQDNLVASSIEQAEDFFSGKLFPVSNGISCDDEYVWNPVLGLYLLLYDVEIDKDFVEYVLSLPSARYSCIVDLDKSPILQDKPKLEPLYEGRLEKTSEIDEDGNIIITILPPSN